MNHLIAVDGDEFTGKTTVVIPALSRYLEEQGFTVKTSREPGGSSRGEKMRMKIFEKLRQGIQPYEQAVLFNKARKNHIDEVIQPFLSTGDKKVMLLDRYLDSTRVYQGLEGGVKMEKLFQLEKKYVGSFFPDISIILYFPENKLAQLINERRPIALYEREKNNEVIPFDKVSIEKHIMRNKNFLKTIDLAKENSEERIILSVNVDGTPEEVSSRVVAEVSKVFI